MRLRYPLALVAALAAGLAAPPAAAQRTVTVAPGNGTLAAAIRAAVDATDSLTTNTFVLQRGGNYVNEGELEIGVPVRIVAADGDGARPLIRAITPSGGETADQVLRVQGDFELRSVRVVGGDGIGGLANRLIRINENDVRVVVDDAVLDEAGQSAFRVNNPGAKLFVTNTTVSNIGETDDPNNGRGIDDRGQDIDSLVVRNSTFYNITSRVLRDDGGRINYAEFDQNTFVNTGQGGTVALGEVFEARVTNNVFYNTGFYGFETEDDEGEAEDDGQIRADAIDASELGGRTQSLVVANNNFYLDPALAAAYPDGVEALPRFDEDAQALLDASGRASGNFSEPLAFDDGVGAPVATVESFYADPEGAQAPFDESGGTVDFGYPETARSFTAGDDGQPVGDRRYFGTSVEPGVPGDGAGGGGADTQVATFAELLAALDDLEAGDTITITADLSVTETIETDEDVTIRGAGDGVRLTAADDFSDRFFEPENDLTLVNLVVDGRGQTEEFVRVRSEDREDGTEDDDGDDDLTIRNVVFANNGGENDGVRFDGDGGTLLIEDSAISGVSRRPIATREDADLEAVIVRRSTIANSADRIRFEGEIAEITFDRVTVSGLVGDGIDFDSDNIGEVTITNSILVPLDGDGNRAVDTSDNPPTITIDNTNVFPLEEGGEGALDSNAQAAFDAGTGNLSVDPMFADPENGDFSLPAGSPLLTAADDGGQIGNPNADVIATPAEGGPEAAALGLRAYPNPLSGRATVAFELASAAEVQVEAFDVLGRRVAVLADGPLGAGAHEAAFDAGALPSGVYVVRLQAGEASRTVRLTVAR